MRQRFVRQPSLATTFPEPAIGRLGLGVLFPEAIYGKTGDTVTPAPGAVAEVEHRPIPEAFT